MDKISISEQTFNEKKDFLINAGILITMLEDGVTFIKDDHIVKFIWQEKDDKRILVQSD